MSKTEVKLRFASVPSGNVNPFARNEVRVSKTEVKLRFQVCRMNPSRTKRGSSVKTEVKLRFQLCVQASVCKASVCKSVCV